MEVALWLKTSAKGVKFMSAQFSEPFVKGEPQIQRNEPQVKEYGDANDDLPF